MSAIAGPRGPMPKRGGSEPKDPGRAAGQPATGAGAFSAAIAAHRAGRLDEALALYDRAIARGERRSGAFTNIGAILRQRRQYAAAAAAHRKALELAPGEAEVLNNLGWSRLLRGDWANALAPLEEAARLAPKNRRVANNVELARAALAADLPQRRPGESEDDWAMRLNDAGVVARLQGDRARAVAAFAQAIEARGSWYERAANNLQAAGGKE